jgi:hypothetical protein
VPAAWVRASAIGSSSAGDSVARADAVEAALGVAGGVADGVADAGTGVGVVGGMFVEGTGVGDAVATRVGVDFGVAVS